MTAVLPSRVGVCGCPLPHIGDGLGAEDLWSCKEPRGELRGVQHGRARYRIDPIVVPTHVPRISHTSCTTSTRREIPKSTLWMSPGGVAGQQDVLGLMGRGRHQRGPASTPACSPQPPAPGRYLGVEVDAAVVVQGGHGASAPGPASLLGVTERGIASENQRLLHTGTPLPTQDPALREKQPRSHPMSPRGPHSSSEVPGLAATSVTSQQASAAGLPGGLSLRLHHQKAQTRLRQPRRNHRGDCGTPSSCLSPATGSAGGPKMANSTAAGPKISGASARSWAPGRRGPQDPRCGQSPGTLGAPSCRAGSCPRPRRNGEPGVNSQKSGGDAGRGPAGGDDTAGTWQTLPALVGTAAATQGGASRGVPPAPCRSSSPAAPPGWLTALPPTGLGLSKASGRVQGGQHARDAGRFAAPLQDKPPQPQILGTQSRCRESPGAAPWPLPAPS